MTAIMTREEPHASTPAVADRLERLEGEIAEFRHTLSDLAEIVVADIKERQETAAVLRESAANLAMPAAAGQSTLTSLRRPWLLIDFLREIGDAGRMFFHPRYRVRRVTQLTMWLILCLFAANYLAFNYTMLDVPVFRQIMERVIEVVLAVLMYRVVSREVTRFRMVARQIAAEPRNPTTVPVVLWNSDPDQAAMTRLESP